MAERVLVDGEAEAGASKPQPHFHYNPAVRRCVCVWRGAAGGWDWGGVELRGGAVSGLGAVAAAGGRVCVPVCVCAADRRGLN